MTLSRRYFLKTSGAAAASFAAAPSFLARTALAQTARPAGRDRPVLVAIFQRGAADGLSMVPPFGDRAYASTRPQIAIGAPRSGSAEMALDLDGFFGLHPALASLKSIYDERHLAIVHAVGSPSNTRSHFDAQDYMECGTPGNKSLGDGWLNRYMQANPEDGATPFRSVAINSNVPRSLMGSAPSIAMTRLADFGLHGDLATTELEEAFADLYKETFEAVKMLRNANPQQYVPAKGIQYPNTSYGRALLEIAQLIKANVGLQ